MRVVKKAVIGGTDFPGSDDIFMPGPGCEGSQDSGQDSGGQYDGNNGYGYHSDSGTYAEGRIPGGYLPDLCDDKFSRGDCTDEGLYGGVQREAAYKER